MTTFDRYRDPRYTGIETYVNELQDSGVALGWSFGLENEIEVMILETADQSELRTEIDGFALTYVVTTAPQEQSPPTVSEVLARPHPSQHPEYEGALAYGRQLVTDGKAYAAGSGADQVVVLLVIGTDESELLTEVDGTPIVYRQTPEPRFQTAVTTQS